jgi:hypothetical protein
MVISWASTRPSITFGTPASLRVARVSTGCMPPAFTNFCRTRTTCRSQRPTSSEIAMSVQPSADISKIFARRSLAAPTVCIRVIVSNSARASAVNTT